MYKHILVPVDGSVMSVRTVSHALDYAKSTGAQLSFFHAVPDYAGSSDGALIHAIEPEALSERTVGHARAILLKAEFAASLASVPCASRYTVSDRPYEAIMRVAEELGCDLIFMASHGRRGLSRLMVGSQTMKLLAHSTLPVLVDTSESNSPRPDMARALDIIQEEHLTLGVMLEQLERVVGELESGRLQPDFAMLRNFIRYLREFPMRLHHPKEDAYLFKAVVQRDPSAAAAIAELEQQHRDEPALVEEMEAQLDCYAAGESGGLAGFAASTGTYNAFVFEHLNFEERSIIPLAREVLTDADWSQIAAAFGENGDPRFDTRSDEQFREAVMQLLYRVPPQDN